MPKNTEIELKLICTDHRVWEEIMTAQSLLDMAVPGSAGRQLLDARYFDTANYCLQKEKIAYRIRREGDQWVATVKGRGSSNGGLHERQEWNVIVTDPQPDLTVFAGTEIGETLIEIVGGQVLEPIMITRFERKTLDIRMPDGSQIEVAADQGEIIAGTKTSPILEVELELKSGRPSSLFALGAMLAKEYPLLPEADSKFYRGLLLAGLVAREAKGDPILPQVHKDEEAGQGLLRVLIELINQFFVAQQVFFRNQAQPEDVHQLRICLRHLRSILEFVGPEALGKYKTHQAQLRKIGQSLGIIREIDVAYAGWKEWSECQPRGMASKLTLGRTLAHRRVCETEKIYGLFYAGYATSILLELWATLTADNWKNTTAYQLTIAEYTKNQFSKWFKKVTKQGQKIEWDDPEKVRKLRLQVKKIKYTLEVLKPVLGKVEELSFQLEELQENLGLLNDIHSTEMVLKKLVKGTTSKVLQLEAGMLIGWQGREALYVQERMNDDWEKFYDDVQKWI